MTAGNDEGINQLCGAGADSWRQEGSTPGGSGGWGMARRREGLPLLAFCHSRQTGTVGTTAAGCRGGAATLRFNKQPPLSARSAGKLG